MGRGDFTEAERKAIADYPVEYALYNVAVGHAVSSRQHRSEIAPMWRLLLNAYNAGSGTDTKERAEEFERLYQKALRTAPTTAYVVRKS